MLIIVTNSAVLSLNIEVLKYTLYVFPTGIQMILIYLIEARKSQENISPRSITRNFLRHFFTNF